MKKYEESARAKAFLDRPVTFRHAPAHINTRRKAIDHYVAMGVLFWECTKEGNKTRNFRAWSGLKLIPISKSEFEYAQSIIDYPCGPRYPQLPEVA